MAVVVHALLSPPLLSPGTLSSPSLICCTALLLHFGDSISARLPILYWKPGIYEGVAVLAERKDWHVRLQLRPSFSALLYLLHFGASISTRLPILFWKCEINECVAVLAEREDCHRHLHLHLHLLFAYCSMCFTFAFWIVQSSLGSVKYARV